jgi:hypothetical protein
MKPKPDLSRDEQTESSGPAQSPRISNGNSSVAAGNGSSDEMTSENPWWKADWFRRWERLAKREG